MALICGELTEGLRGNGGQRDYLGWERVVLIQRLNLQRWNHCRRYPGRDDALICPDAGATLQGQIWSVYG